MDNGNSGSDPDFRIGSESRRRTKESLLARCRLVLIPLGLGSLLQGLPVPDQTFATVLSHLKVLREFQSIRGAGIFTEPAKHAPAEVVGKFRQFLASCHGIAFAAYNDEVLWAHDSTEVTGDAQGLVCVGVYVEARCAAETLGNLGSLQGILLGDELLRRLVAECHAQTLNQVNQQHFA
jgi:hypothetical protein